MESLDERIRAFLAVNNGSGSGSGSGSGYGYGYGDGSGSGSGSGYGYGDGDGDGSWRAFAGRPVYYIDELPTLIDTVHTSYAKGSIIREDLTLQPCYIARVGDYFAHGDTLRQARADAQEKYDESRPLEERIDAFVREHPDLDTPYGDLFRWHHTLTGSCEMGRKEWCRAHNLQPTDSITVRAFIDGTVNDYGGDAIRELAKAYDYDPQN